MLLPHALRAAGASTGRISVVTSVTGSNVSSLNFPVSLQQGDIVIYAGSNNTASSTLPATPTGYTDFGTGTGVPPNITRKVSYKVMGATPDTSIAGMTSSTSVAHAVIVLRGVSGVPASVTAAFGTSATPDSPNITNVPRKAMMFSFAFIRSSAAVTAPAGYSLITSTAASSTTAIAYKGNSIGGSINPPAFSSANVDWGAFTSYIASS